MLNGDEILQKIRKYVATKNAFRVEDGVCLIEASQKQGGQSFLRRTDGDGS